MAVLAWHANTGDSVLRSENRNEVALILFSFEICRIAQSQWLVAPVKNNEIVIQFHPMELGWGPATIRYIQDP